MCAVSKWIRFHSLSLFSYHSVLCGGVSGVVWSNGVNVVNCCLDTDFHVVCGCGHGLRTNQLFVDPDLYVVCGCGHVDQSVIIQECLWLPRSDPIIYMLVAHSLVSRGILWTFI